jgi:cysteine desulfuration protein SufE
MAETKSITELEQVLIDDFSLFDTWEEKYEYLIDLGKKLAPLDPSYKTEDYKIKGCQSSVWIHSAYKD